MSAAIAAAMRVVGAAMRAGTRVTECDGSALTSVVREAREILVVVLAEIGDTVLATAFVDAVARTAPQATITVVARPGLAGLFESSGARVRAVEYDPTASRALRPLILPMRARAFARRTLRDREFDVAIVPRWDTDHHLASAVAAFSRARRRVTFGERSTERKRVLNAGFDSLFTDVLNDDAPRHEVERLGLLAERLGASIGGFRPRVESTDTDKRAARELVGADAATSLVAIGLGAGDPKRRWPAERFAAVAQRLASDCDVRVVTVGGAGDRSAEAEVVRALGDAVVPLAGKLTLRETAAVLRECALFVGNDSGPMHLAAAVATPCVEISCHPAGASPLHHNAPERFHPWGVPHVVLRPTHAAASRCAGGCTAAVAHCILDVTVEDVVRACEALLAVQGSQAR